MLKTLRSFVSLIFNDFEIQYPISIQEYLMNNVANITYLPDKKQIWYYEAKDWPPGLVAGCEGTVLLHYHKLLEVVSIDLNAREILVKPYEL